MDLTPLSTEDIEAIRSAVPWIKVFGTGTFLSLIVGLWKIFGIYKRLEDVEEKAKALSEANLLTITRHEELASSCKATVDAKIEKAINDLHLKWADKMEEVKGDISDIKETQCHVLGELKQISIVLNKLMK